MSIHSDLSGDLEFSQLDPTTLNGELLPSRSAINAALIGMPRGTISSFPAEPEDPEFERLLETSDLGPFEVTGLAPAVRKLRAIVTDISLELPLLYDRLGCAEMQSCRLVKGSKSVVSSHSWGLALDLTIDGKSETDGCDEVMEALVRLWPIFNRHGFYWGYAFGLPDATHFEASDQLVRGWADSGAFDGGKNVVLPRAYNLGDRGPHIKKIQSALNQRLRPVCIDEDGLFGPQTRMAIFSFQRKRGLPPTGAASKPVISALGLGE